MKSPYQHFEHLTTTSIDSWTNYRSCTWNLNTIVSEIDVTVTLFKKKRKRGYVPSKSCITRKGAFCTCKNKDADQLHCGRAADQQHCFRYIDGSLAPLPKSEISSL